MRVVGHPNRVGLVAPGDGDEHRAEDLFTGDPPVVPHVREDGRLDVVPGRERSFRRRRATDHRPRALLVDAFVDVADDLVELLAAHDRAHVARFVERVADLQLRELRRELVEEGVEDARVDEEPRAGGAGLALPGEAHRCDHPIGGALLVGIGEQDLRALSAELQRHRDDAVGRQTEDRFPGLGVPGEGDLPDERMLRERRADLLARAGDDVEHALGEMRGADAGEMKHGEWRVRRRLQHHGVSCDQRWGNFPRGDEDGHVPRHDRRDDAVRLAARVAEHRLAERDRLAFELAAKAAEVAEDVGDRLRLGARLRADGVPRLGRERAREVLDGRVDVVGDAQEQSSAIPGGDRAPGRERRGGGPHRLVDVGRSGPRHMRDDLAARRGRLDIESAAIGALDPLAADEHPLARRRRRAGGHRHLSARRHRHARRGGCPDDRRPQRR